MSMQVTIGATEVRIHQGSEHLVVEKLGIPVAVLISVKEYEQFQHWQAAQLHQTLSQSVSREAEAQDLTEEELLNELRDTRRQVFNETYGDLK